ncbi:MAG: EamA family transporter [Anaerolineales bacterium]|nr:EamA family transporter [Anaerolineales bacterium]
MSDLQFQPTAENPTTSPSTEARWVGAALCALSAAGFASLTILGKFALTIDISVTTLLGIRFGGAAILLVIYLKLIRRRRIAPGIRVTLTLFFLGAVGYASQSALYFGALGRIPASLNSLLLYVYPIFVALFGWLIYHRAPTWREWGAMVLASFGVALTLGVGEAGSMTSIGPIDKLGVAMVLTSAAGYALYIVSSEHVVNRAGPWISTTWISAGAGVSFIIAGLLSDTLNSDLPSAATWLLPAVILFSTILPVGTLLAGIARVGPTMASLISTLEPIFTVLTAVLLLNETLSTFQLVGGGFVLSAVVLLTLPTRAQRPTATVIHVPE